MSLLLTFFMLREAWFAELVASAKDAVSSDTCNVVRSVISSVLPESSTKSCHIKLSGYQYQKNNAQDLFFTARARLHQASALTLPLLCDDTMDTVLIENNEVV